MCACAVQYKRIWQLCAGLGREGGFEVKAIPKKDCDGACIMHRQNERAAASFADMFPNFSLACEAVIGQSLTKLRDDNEGAHLQKHIAPRRPEHNSE